MNENGNTNFTCSGDCLKCSVQQRIYCASQMSRNAIPMLEAILVNQTSILERLERIEKAQENKDEEIINPMAETPSEGSEEPNLDNAQ